MAKTYDELLSELTETEEGKDKINIVKNALLSETMDDFKQLFAIVARTTLQTLLGISFYAFPKKVANPGLFTLDEIDFMAELFKVEFDVMLRFIRKAKKGKGKRKG
ncbi:hypothetical protein [Chitinophaga sp. GbtcB8]|uniref:hypothetical protein n=1 Tax=Chitinophaga sp. GbtcB8 TaxID=2824753 RepID=UPI001C2F55D6|nr:hypothetical protein [Chitinophaga sp. GbtcB8]